MVPELVTVTNPPLPLEPPSPPIATTLKAAATNRLPPAAAAEPIAPMMASELSPEGADGCRGW